MRYGEVVRDFKGLCVCARACVCTRIHSPEARVVGGCEPLNIGGQLNSGFSGRVASVPNNWTISPTPENYVLKLHHRSTETHKQRADDTATFGPTLCMTLARKWDEPIQDSLSSSVLLALKAHCILTSHRQYWIKKSAREEKNDWLAGLCLIHFWFSTELFISNLLSSCSDNLPLLFVLKRS